MALSVQVLPPALTLWDIYDALQMADAWCICNYGLMATCILCLNDISVTAVITRRYSFEENSGIFFFFHIQLRPLPGNVEFWLLCLLWVNVSVSVAWGVLSFNLTLYPGGCWHIRAQCGGSLKRGWNEYWRLFSRAVVVRTNGLIIIEYALRANRWELEPSAGGSRPDTHWRHY